MKSLADQLAGLSTPPLQATPESRQRSKRPAGSVGVDETAAKPLYPSMAAPARVQLVDFPLRLSVEAIAQLKTLQRTRGIVPSRLVRDFVDAGLASLEGSAQ